MTFAYVTAVTILMGVATGSTGAERQQVIAAAGVQHVTIHVDSGSVAIRPSPESTPAAITATAIGGPGCDAATLRATRTGNRLELTAAQVRSCEPRWVLEIPSTMGLVLQVADGDVSIAEAEGDLHVDGGVGAVTVVASGSISVDRRVGRVRVTSTAPCHAMATVETRVGRAVLRLRGSPVRAHTAPGSGNRVELDGPGRVKLKVTVGVGAADLDLAAPGVCA